MVPLYDLDADLFRVCDAPVITQPLLSACLRISLRCSETCSYCMVDASPLAPQPKEDTIRDILQVLACEGPLRVVWSGGEPLEYPWLSACLKCARALGHVNALSTHGSIAPTDAICRHTDWFHISVPSTHGQTYKAMCGKDDAARVIATIRNLVRGGSRVAACVLLCNTTLPTALQTIEDLAGIGVQKLWLTHLHMSERATHSDHLPITDTELAAFREQAEGGLREREVAIMWPAVRKRDIIRRAYVVVDGTGTVETPSAMANLNVLTSPHLFWRRAKSISKEHWQIFTAPGE